MPDAPRTAAAARMRRLRRQEELPMRQWQCMPVIDEEAAGCCDQVVVTTVGTRYRGGPLADGDSGGSISADRDFAASGAGSETALFLKAAMVGRPHQRRLDTGHCHTKIVDVWITDRNAPAKEVMHDIEKERREPLDVTIGNRRRGVGR